MPNPNNIDPFLPHRPGRHLKSAEMEALRRSAVAFHNTSESKIVTVMRLAKSVSEVPGRNEATGAPGEGTVSLFRMGDWDSGTPKLEQVSNNNFTVYNLAKESVSADAFLVIGLVDSNWFVLWEECQEETGGGGGGGGALPPIGQAYNVAWGVITATTSYTIPRDSVLVLVGKPGLTVTTMDPTVSAVVSPRFRLRGVDYQNTCTLVAQGGKIERQDSPNDWLGIGESQEITLPVEYIWDVTDSRWLLWDGSPQPTQPVVPSRAAFNVGRLPVKK